jgi:hypothetical protein
MFLGRVNNESSKTRDLTGFLTTYKALFFKSKTSQVCVWDRKLVDIRCESSYTGIGRFRSAGVIYTERSFPLPAAPSLVWRCAL